MRSAIGTITLLIFTIFSFPATAGFVIVSGDVSPAFGLTEDYPSYTNPSDNRTFFKNILADGDSVAIIASNNNSEFTEQLRKFYSQLPGVSANIVQTIDLV